ncbi:MAG: formate dehydrogenase subunit gamma [Gammaproteobacteria bacterium]
MSTNKQSRIRRHRMVAYSLLSLLVLTLVLPLIPYAVADRGDTTGKVVNPGTELWRDVRQRDRAVAGSTQVRGVDTGILINVYGEDWRVFRMQRLIPYGAALMGTVLSVILLFYLVRGPLRMQGGPAGNRIQRFTVFERTTHWFTVSVFWLLALTGLILLYGRYVLIPLLGPDGFGLTASACKEAHNLFGPMFLVAILMLFVTFVKDNIYARGDMTWLLKGGGMLGGGHVSAGRFNAGEKIWFWIAVLGGIVLCATGLILDFAVLGQGREVMALSHVLHGIVALIVISVSFGHIYLGTAGVEGTLGSMTTGYVDEAWAKSHHDRWYAEVKASAAGQVETEPAGGGTAATGVASTARDG